MVKFGPLRVNLKPPISNFGLPLVDSLIANLGPPMANLGPLMANLVILGQALRSSDKFGASSSQVETIGAQLGDHF